MILLLPPVSFMLVASFMNHINIGLRHVLPVYPFLCLIAGAAWAGISNGTIKKAALTVFGIFYLFTAARNLTLHQDALSYFSEWIGDAEQGAQLTADSNLDWGQNNRRLLELAKRLEIKKLKIALKSRVSELPRKDRDELKNRARQEAQRARRYKEDGAGDAYGRRQARPRGAVQEGTQWQSR